MKRDLYLFEFIYFVQNKINKFLENYKSHRGPTYFKIYIHSFFGPTTYIFIYTPYKERRPQETKPMNKRNKMIKEVLENFEDIKENQKRLEEEVKESHSKINIFVNQKTLPLPKKPEENNTKSIMEYLEKKSQLPREYGRNPNKGERIQNKKLKMWGNPLNQRKITFFHAIKSEETAKIYNEFMKKDKIFILRKFQEKINPQDTEEQNKIKTKLNLMELKAQTEIQEDKTTHYKTKYQEIDQELITEIIEIFPKDTTISKKKLGKELQKGGRKIKKNPEQKNLRWCKGTSDGVMVSKLD